MINSIPKLGDDTSICYLCGGVSTMTGIFTTNPNSPTVGVCNNCYTSNQTTGKCLENFTPN